jgi:hypothetical protein
MKEMQLSLLLNMESSASVFNEVGTIVLEMIPEYGLETLEQVFADTVSTSYGIE